MIFTRTLNISGERQIDKENDKWVHFSQSYPIPQNCEEGKLQANFAHGVLTITMPKKILSQHNQKPEAQQKGPFTSPKQELGPGRRAQEDILQKTQEMPTALRMEEPKPEKAQEKTPLKYVPPRFGELKPTTKEMDFQKILPNQDVEPRTKNDQEDLNHEKAYESMHHGFTPTKLEEQKPEEAREEEIPFRFRIPRGKADLIQKFDDQRELKALGSQEPTNEHRPVKGQHEETESKPPTIKPQRKPIDEIEHRPMIKIAPKKPENGKPEKASEEIVRERESKKEELKGKVTEKPGKMFKEKEIRTRKWNEEMREKGKGNFLTKENIISAIGKGISQLPASTSEFVTKVLQGKWKEEEKPMLVNIGAAILVIAALGVYVSSKITSSGST